MRKWKLVVAGLALVILMPVAAQVRLVKLPQATTPAATPVTAPAATTPATTPVARPAAVPATALIDWQAQYRKEVEKNKTLRSENTSLRAQLDAYTSRTGSHVTAYCETETVSRNTAGDSNDCSRNGFRCEKVSGLCRTVAHSSDECAAGYTYCSLYNNCVHSANECQRD
jgi:hypothetical protein